MASTVGLWTIRDCASKGRCLISNSKIKEGSIILSEFPLACVPFLYSCERGRMSLTTGPFALNEVESSMLHAAGKNFSGRTIMLASRLILSTTRHISIKEQTSSLCYHSQLQISDDMKAVAQIVKRLVDFNQYSQQRSGEIHRVTEVTELYCLQILSRLQCNGFTIVDDSAETVGIAVYSTASAINHDCDPVAMQSFDATTGKVTIRSIKPIEVGEEITIAYIDVGKPAWWRRSELLQSYYFVCSCSRCTYESSHILPNSAWCCANAACGSKRGCCHVIQSDEVEMALLRLHALRCPAVSPRDQEKYVDSIELYYKWLAGEACAISTTENSVLLAPKIDLSDGHTATTMAHANPSVYSATVVGFELSEKEIIVPDVSKLYSGIPFPDGHTIAQSHGDRIEGGSKVMSKGEMMGKSKREMMGRSKGEMTGKSKGEMTGKNDLTSRDSRDPAVPLLTQQQCPIDNGELHDESAQCSLSLVCTSCLAVSPLQHSGHIIACIQSICSILRTVTPHAPPHSPTGRSLPALRQERRGLQQALATLSPLLASDSDYAVVALRSRLCENLLATIELILSEADELEYGDDIEERGEEDEAEEGQHSHEPMLGEGQSSQDRGSSSLTGLLDDFISSARLLSCGLRACYPRRHATIIHHRISLARVLLIRSQQSLIPTVTATGGREALRSRPRNGSTVPPPGPHNNGATTDRSWHIEAKDLLQAALDDLLITHGESHTLTCNVVDLLGTIGG